MPTAFGFVPGVSSGDWVVTLPHDVSIGEVLVYAVPHISTSDLETEMLADSPVALWPLNETAGTTALDISGNGHHGTYAGTYALADQTFPVGGDHTRFANSSTVDVADADAFSSAYPGVGYSGEMTLEGWVYLDGFYASDNAIVLCKAGGASGNIEWVLSISPDGSADGYGFIAPSTLIGRCTAPAGTITTASWHHLVFTYDRAAPLAALYVDGSSVDTNGVFAGDTVNTTQKIELGHREFVVGGAGHWQTLGALAYLAYYDHALDATRVAVHYAAGL